MGALALRGFDAKAVGKAKIAPYVFLPAPRSVEYSGKCVPRGKEVKKTVSIDPKTVTQEQGYRLVVSTGQVEIIAHDKAGAFYALTRWPTSKPASSIICLSASKFCPSVVRYPLVNMELAG